jgi:hypothetical protein
MKKSKRKHLLLVISMFCLFLIFILILLCSFEINGHIVINNALFSRFTNDFYSIELPEGTEDIGRYEDFGLINRNGNHCDFFAGMLIKSDLSESEVLEYYKDYNIKSVTNGEELSPSLFLASFITGYEKLEKKNETLEIEVIHLTEERYDEILGWSLKYPDPVMTWIKKENKEELLANDRNIYLLYIFDSDYPGFDPRCI